LLSASTLVAAAALGAPAVSHAFDPAIGAQVTFGTAVGGAGDLLSVAPQFHVFVPVSDSFAVHADAGFAFLSQSGTSADSGVALMNPFIAGYYTRSVSSMRFKVGLGVAAPLYRATEGAAAAAVGGAAQTLGNWNPWTYGYQTLSVAAPARLELKLSDSFMLAADGAIAVMIPAGDLAGDTNLALQLGAEAIIPLPIVDLGAYLRFVTLPTQDNSNQLSVGPFVQLKLGPAYARAQLNINLNEPFGPSFASGTEAWGLTLGAGLKF
jgi:hypothetical protein